jgi:hypothetical protein
VQNRDAAAVDERRLMARITEAGNEQQIEDRR